MSVDATNPQVKVWDGTNTAAVKAASTAPVAADPAVATTISPNVFAASNPGLPVNPYGMAATLFASGQVADPAAGAAIATLTTPPAGTYRIDFTCGIFVALATAGDNANMEFRKGAAVQLSRLGGVAGVTEAALATVGSSPMHETLFKDIRMTLDGVTSISINATAAGVAGNTYVAQIMATRIF